MKIDFDLKKALWLSFLITQCLPSYGQKLPESRTTSYYTYIYQITGKEARKIYKNDIWVVDASFFHTPVDSFTTDGHYTGRLPQGHYLKTFSDKNKQKMSVTTIQNFEVFILNNNTDLCIQVYDPQGNIIPDATVQVRGKNIRYNKENQSYTDRKSNRKGLLSVSHDNFTAYYNLNRQYDNSCIKRGTRKAVYNAPLKYVWIPINFVINLPIDGAKSIIRGWPQGTIYRTNRFFNRSFRSIAGIFDDSYREYNTGDKFTQNHTGYLVFNKPKYLPEDTVRFKAFLVTNDGKPVDKTVKVILEAFKKDIKLTELQPYREGGYEYQFFLHDSLQLQLDRNYFIRLELNEKKKYISRSFKYEDYELSKVKLTLRLDNAEHFRDSSVILYIEGTDENDLSLPDARTEILVRPGKVDKYHGSHVFVPDTLLFLEKKLAPADETIIELPDTTFPKADFEYNISVRLITSDNEVITENKTVQYFYDSEKFEMELIADSISFRFRKNGVQVGKHVYIEAGDNYGNSTKVFEGRTPCTLELNSYYAYYRITNGFFSETFNISGRPSLLHCFSDRTADSVIIVVDNPRKIPFIYNIYKRNTEKETGYSESLNLRQKSTSKANYFVSIRYVWGGKVKEDNYLIPLEDKKLEINVTQPKIIYPGQKTKIELLVTDQRGEPVEGVDLTAYAMTKKFGYEPPIVPYLGRSGKNKSVINNFSFGTIKPGLHTGLNLDYDAWKLLAGIDSIEYYKFIYPGEAIYRFEYLTPDRLTQFAPFVIENGAIQPIHVIYVDNKPVYFSWSTHTQPYSFQVDCGYHQIRLRTSNRSITIDSLYFTQGKKLIFSLNKDMELKNIRTEKVKPELSAWEKKLLYKYIFPYRHIYGEKYAYLEQGNFIQFLEPEKGYHLYNNMAGPVAGNVIFHLMDSFSTTFYHEPFFEYEFSQGLLKMRSLDVNRYPKYLFSSGREVDLSANVLTKIALFKQWEDYLCSKRYNTARYKYPGSTSPGYGRLLINITGKSDSSVAMPVNILVFRYDKHEFLRVYPGNTSLIHELEEGPHRLIFFYPGSTCHIEDSVMIKPNGLNYYEFTQPTEFRKDAFSIYVSDLIEKTIFKPAPYSYQEEKEMKEIFNMYRQQFQFTGDGDTVEGYVYDKLTGEPLPGVSINIKGTTYGTVTDLNGYYSLKVPTGGSDILCFSFIGYSTEERPVHSNILNVTLNEDICMLDEVVVIGYGSQKKFELTGSVATVTTGRLPGNLPGVEGGISGSLQGSLAGINISPAGDKTDDGVEIQIKGASIVRFDNTPLVIINGNIYLGNISEIDPSLIRHIEILKDDAATAMYGARGANGVIIIETKSGTFKAIIPRADKGADFDDAFYEATLSSGSVRSNFSDYAFWQPSLITDKEGKALFEVTFPDDVTSWETFYLAMNGKKHSGQVRSLIKSYKPVIATLAVPRFLIKSDTVLAIGKVINYTSDSMEVTTRFEVNDEVLFSKTGYCTNSIIDTLTIVASDSVTVKYFMENADGYIDGEQRDIAIFPAGLEETKGSFYVLDSDTTVHLEFDIAGGDVTLYAKADILDVIDDEISHLIRYRYSCNEQLASKLKALLAERSIAGYKGEKFRNESEVNKLIRLLLKNQKDNGLWGWWPGSLESDWISLHVLEALMQSEKQGYEVKLNKRPIIEKLIWDLESSRDFKVRLGILGMLKLMNAQVSYSTYISELEKAKEMKLKSILQIVELRQKCNLKYNLDTLIHFQKTTIYGNIFYDDERESSLLANDIQNTLHAYRILRADSTDHSDILRKIRNYLFEKRKHGYWRNTYESAAIIETILPDLIIEKSLLTKPSLELSGDLNLTVKEFPFEMVVNPGMDISVLKTGSFPVYFTSYQRYWNNSPSITGDDFEISTRFLNDSALYFRAGQEITLVADVILKKNAEYVMINVPIPGGCSYAEKKNNFRNESHREYFRNETTIFCEKLKTGSYTFEIRLMPRYTGVYTLNPAKVEMMYFPIFNANNEIKKVGIEN